MFFGIKSRPICRHASEDVERDIRAFISPMSGRVPALRLVPGINIHVVVEHRNTNLLIGFLNVFVILALVFLALTCVYVVRCLHEQVFQNGKSCGALERSFQTVSACSMLANDSISAAMFSGVLAYLSSHSVKCCSR